MNGRLASAVRPALPPGVDRLDPRPDGSLLVQLRSGRWYHCDDVVCTPCRPEADDRLPLSRAWAELAAEGEVEVLSHRPGRRLVVRVRTGDGESRILKGTRRRRLDRMAARHQAAAAGLAASPLRAAELIDVDEQRACLVLADAGGVPFDLSPGHAERFFRVGAGLRRLQERCSCAGLDVHGPRQELDVLDGARTLAVRAGAPVPPGWREARRELGELEATVATADMRPSHRDLHDGQLLAARGALVLLDFDLLCRADPLLDAANLLVHLKLREMQGLSGAELNTVDVGGRALLDGLDRNRETVARARLRFYEASTFLRLAVVYALRRRWVHLTSELVDLSRRCLHDDR